MLKIYSFLRYLSYRFFNYIAISIFFIKVDYPMFLRNRFGFYNCLPKAFYFKLKGPLVHLGDRLFFLNTFYFLNQIKFIFFIEQNDQHTIKLLESFNIKFYLDNSSYFEQYADNILSIVTVPSFLNKWWKLNIFKNCLLINFNDPNVNNKISFQLLLSLSNYLVIDDNIVLHDFCFPKFRNSDLLPDNIQITLFNNQIDSGFFRKLFINENRFIHALIDSRLSGCLNVCIGSYAGTIDSKFSELIDLDLRGKTSIQEVILLVADPRVLKVITYDNFIMHLSGIFNKKTYVIFRGRFQRKYRVLHFSFINPNFFDKKNLITYL